MGMLRLLLAATVVFVHAGFPLGFPTINGSLAVQTFYMISGFYMALILNEKYTDQPHAYRLFLTNRLLRLLPVYYVVLSLTILVAIGMMLTLGEPQLEFFRALRYQADGLPLSAKTLLVLSNLTLIGQDWLSFLTVSPQTGALVFSPDSTQVYTNLNSLLMVQPGWTVSLELTFYVFAPFLVRRRAWVLVLLIIGSAGLRILFRQYAQLGGLAWSYRFFPFELLFFLSGALAYKAYRHLRGVALPGWLCPAILAMALLLTAGFGLLHQYAVAGGMSAGLASGLYRLAMACSLPFIFRATKNSLPDTRLGELSYPLYLVHFLVYETLLAYGVPTTYLSLLTLALSVWLAWAINASVGKNVEKVRQRVFEQGSGQRRHSLS